MLNCISPEVKKQNGRRLVSETPFRMRKIGEAFFIIEGCVI